MQQARTHQSSARRLKKISKVVMLSALLLIEVINPITMQKYDDSLISSDWQSPAVSLCVDVIGRQGQGRAKSCKSAIISSTHAVLSMPLHVLACAGCAVKTKM